MTDSPDTYGLDDPDKIWPEDVMTEEEWDHGWFDRQLVYYGTVTEHMRPDFPAAFGGARERATS